jgi:hypothetical protein
MQKDIFQFKRKSNYSGQTPHFGARSAGIFGLPAAGACRGAFAPPRRLDGPLTPAHPAVALFVAPVFNDWPEFGTRKKRYFPGRTALHFYCAEQKEEVKYT